MSPAVLLVTLRAAGDGGEREREASGGGGGRERERESADGVWTRREAAMVSWVVRCEGGDGNDDGWRERDEAKKKRRGGVTKKRGG